jgi:type IV pilus assembly protein PilC
MPVYTWVGTARGGAVRKGEIEADDEDQVTAQLRRLRITPTKIKAKPKDISEYITFLQPKVTRKDVVMFTRQFATMINAGLPLVQGLEILAKQQENKALQKKLKGIKEDVEQGSTLADTLKKYPEMFDDLYVNMVAAGEVGGILDTILTRLALYMEKAQKLKKKVKGALVYPAVVVSVAVIVIAVILIFVIPVFQEMFASMGQALPLPTQIVVNLSSFLKSNIIYMIVAVFLMFYAFKRFYKTERGRDIIDKNSLKAPIFGPLLRKVAVARFTSTLSTMLKSGVPILDALDIVAKTAGNTVVEAGLVRTQSAIREGQTMSEPLAETGIFPPMVVQMIGVGEATGELDAMLGKIAEVYEEEVDAAVEALTSMLEPLLMVFLGGTIGGLVVSMYLPIFQMAGALTG